MFMGVLQQPRKFDVVEYAKDVQDMIAVNVFAA
jgi:hypothetical protein